MTDDQLKKGNVLNRKHALVQKTVNRAGTLAFGWNQNGTWYKFTQDEFTKDDFSGDDRLLKIFVDVNETARILLIQKLKSLTDEIQKEFDTL